MRREARNRKMWTPGNRKCSSEERRRDPILELRGALGGGGGGGEMPACQLQRATRPVRKCQKVLGETSFKRIKLIASPMCRKVLRKRWTTGKELEVGKKSVMRAQETKQTKTQSQQL